MRPWDAWIQQVQRSGRLIFVVFTLLTVAALFGASKVGVDNAVDIWFPDDDPALMAYQNFQADFGNDEVVVMGIHDDAGILSPSGLAKVRRVTQAAESVQGVAKVQSMTNTPTADAKQTVAQIKELADAGTELVRITVNDAAAMQAVLPQFVDCVLPNEVHKMCCKTFFFSPCSIFYNF